VYRIGEHLDSVCLDGVERFLDNLPISDENDILRAEYAAQRAGVEPRDAFREARRDAALELAAALHGLPADPPVLFVVDNIPEPPPGRPRFPHTWCPALGEVTLLTTSRHRRPSTAGIVSSPVDVLQPSPAVQLLTRGYLHLHRLTEPG
jgi:hypothetical protein